MDEITGEWIKCYSEELPNMNFSQNTLRMIMLRVMG
jgi:hypothetical protein